MQHKSRSFAFNSVNVQSLNRYAQMSFASRISSSQWRASIIDESFEVLDREGTSIAQNAAAPEIQFVPDFVSFVRQIHESHTEHFVVLS